jgi:hypothetical protein
MSTKRGEAMLTAVQQVCIARHNSKVVWGTSWSMNAIRYDT